MQQEPTSTHHRSAGFATIAMALFALTAVAVAVAYGINANLSRDEAVNQQMRNLQAVYKAQSAVEYVLADVAASGSTPAQICQQYVSNQPLSGYGVTFSSGGSSPTDTCSLVITSTVQQGVASAVFASRSVKIGASFVSDSGVAKNSDPLYELELLNTFKNPAASATALFNVSYIRQPTNQDQCAVARCDDGCRAGTEDSAGFWVRDSSNNGTKFTCSQSSGAVAAQALAATLTQGASKKASISLRAVANNTEPTVQSALLNRNAVIAGILLRSAPDTTSYLDTDVTATTGLIPNAPTSFRTISRGWGDWCGGSASDVSAGTNRNNTEKPDLLILLLSGRGDGQTSAPIRRFSEVRFDTGSAPSGRSQPKNFSMTAIARFPEIGQQTKVADSPDELFINDVFVEAFYIYNPFFYAASASVISNNGLSATVRVPTTAGLKVGTYISTIVSGNNLPNFQPLARVETISNNTDFVVTAVSSTGARINPVLRGDSANSSLFANMPICGGICAFFRHDAQGGSSAATEFSVTTQPVPFAWAGGFFCVGAGSIDPAVDLVKILGRKKLNGFSWSEPEI